MALLNFDAGEHLAEHQQRNQQHDPAPTPNIITGIIADLQLVQQRIERGELTEIEALKDWRDNDRLKPYLLQAGWEEEDLANRARSSFKAHAKYCGFRADDPDGELGSFINYNTLNWIRDYLDTPVGAARVQKNNGKGSVQMHSGEDFLPYKLFDNRIRQFWTSSKTDSRELESICDFKFSILEFTERLLRLLVMQGKLIEVPAAEFNKATGARVQKSAYKLNPDFDTDDWW